MPDFCSCGAELPPDARFCHRCGKPQRDEPPIEIVEIAPLAAITPPVAPAAQAAPPRLNFHNATAVRVGLLIASVASLLSALPALAGGLLGLAIWWLSAGFLAVLFYRRRTGELLTVDGGLRMGWITGVLGATITAVLFTVSLVSMISGGKISALYEEQVRKMSANDPNVQEALRILKSPSGMVVFVIVALLFSFLMITFLCTAGGALGAKLGGGITAPGPKRAP